MVSEQKWFFWGLNLLEEFPTLSESGSSAVIYSKDYGLSGYLIQMDADLLNISWTYHGYENPEKLS